jgi:hypothetical protein
MSTSTKSPNTIRQGGPGASHENAKSPLEVKKPTADDPQRQRSKASRGGGERDGHHTHDPRKKAAAHVRPTKGVVMQGKKTHEKQLRILENKDEVPNPRRSQGSSERNHIPASNKRESEFPVSRGGVNQESGHNKHNDEGQRGHKPQQHTPGEEKH